MDYKFRNLKDSFSDDEGHLPQELDWVRMQEGIMNKMEALEAESATRPKRSYRTIYRAIAVLGLLLIPMLCSRDSRNDRLLTVEHLKPSGLSFDNNSEQKPTEKQTREKQPDRKPETSERATMAGAAGIATTSRKPTGLVPEQTTGPAISIPDEMNATASHSDTPDLAVLEEKPDETVPALPTRQFAPQYEPAEAVWEPAIPKRSKKHQNNNLSASAGIAFWSPGYGKSKPVRHEYEKSRLSYTANLTYTHPLKRGYHFSVGLQYVQLESRFNWGTTLNNYNKIELSDTVVQVQINAISGEQTKVYGDVDVWVNANRSVQHYNTTRLVQVPLAIGKSFSHKKWSSDMSIGGALNILSSNKGRTLLDQGEVIDFEGSRTALVDNQWKVHAFVAGQIRYLIDEQMGINAGITYQRSLSDWSRQEGVTMRPGILSMNVGLSYRFSK